MVEIDAFLGFVIPGPHQVQGILRQEFSLSDRKQLMQHTQIPIELPPLACLKQGQGIRIWTVVTSSWFPM